MPPKLSNTTLLRDSQTSNNLERKLSQCDPPGLCETVEQALQEGIRKWWARSRAFQELQHAADRLAWARVGGRVDDLVLNLGVNGAAAGLQIPSFNRTVHISTMKGLIFTNLYPIERCWKRLEEKLHQWVTQFT